MTRDHCPNCGVAGPELTTKHTHTVRGCVNSDCWVRVWQPDRVGPDGNEKAAQSFLDAVRFWDD